MAKAVLEYDLDNNEDALAHLKAVKSTDAFIALWDVTELFRQKLKYSDLDDITFNVIEKMQDEFNDILTYHGISEDMLR